MVIKQNLLETVPLPPGHTRLSLQCTIPAKNASPLY